MVPYKPTWNEDVLEAVERGYVKEDRIDVAVDRVLALKARVGLLPLPDGAAGTAATPSGGVAPPAIATGDLVSEDTIATENEQSLAAAVEGIVLLKNTGDVLPLGSAGSGAGEDYSVSGTVAVTGPSAKSAANLLGGWSLHWQGATTDDEVCCSLVAQRPSAADLILALPCRFVVLLTEWACAS